MLIAMTFGLISRADSAYRPDPNSAIDGFCKARVYFGQSATMIYRWSLTMACIDRYASSSANVSVRGFAKPYIAYRVVLSIAIIWIILPVHNLIFHKINGGLCIWSLAAVAMYNSIFTIILGGIIPPLIMITSIVLIRNNLKDKRERRCQNNGQSTEKEADRIVRVRDRQTLLMLFIQTTFYISLTLPWTTFLVYSAFTSNLNNKSSNRIAIESFAQYLTETLAYSYSTLSFYLYTLTSPTFRQQLINLIYDVLKCKIRCFGRSNRVQPN
jgi:hypothetical protein